MKKAILFSIALLLSAAGSALAQTASGNSAVEAKIQATEKSLWEAWKNHDTKPFKEDLTADAVNINADGSVDRGVEAILKGVNDTSCTVSSSSLSDFSFLWIDRDSVVVTYTGNIDATCGGHKIPPKVVASSIWSKKGGKWVSAFHQESAPPPPAA